MKVQRGWKPLLFLHEQLCYKIFYWWAHLRLKVQCEGCEKGILCLCRLNFSIVFSLWRTNEAKRET